MQVEGSGTEVPGICSSSELPLCVNVASFAKSPVTLNWEAENPLIPPAAVRNVNEYGDVGSYPLGVPANSPL